MSGGAYGIPGSGLPAASAPPAEAPHPVVFATPIVTSARPATPLPPASSRAHWIALSLLITCVVGLIITSSLIKNPQLYKTYLASFCITAVFSIAVLLGALFQHHFRGKKSTLVTAIGWAAIALLTTCLVALLVVSFVPKNPLAPKICYPVFSLLGAGSLLVIAHSIFKQKPLPVV